MPTDGLQFMGGSFMRLFLPLLWAAALVPAAAGCGQGGDNLPRQAVSGKVTIDGQPLDTGEITFVPTAGAGAGPAAGGKVENGAYSISRADRWEERRVGEGGVS